jgi:hypothetical protein
MAEPSNNSAIAPSPEPGNTAAPITAVPNTTTPKYANTAAYGPSTAAPTARGYGNGDLESGRDLRSVKRAVWWIVGIMLFLIFCKIVVGIIVGVSALKSSR